MILREADLFHGVSDQLAEALTGIMVKMSLDTGQVLVKEGEPADNLFVLARGSLKLSVVGAGRTTHQATRTGEVVGWSSVAGRESYSATVTCDQPAEVYRINKDELDKILRSHPLDGLLFYKRLAGLVGERLIGCHRLLAGLSRS